jgi:MFS family permease
MQQKWRSIRESILPPWLTRDMRLLLVARIFMSTARAVAGIIVPIYLSIVGFNAIMLGLLFLVVAITSAILSSLSGLLSDRFGRKPFIIFIPLLTAIASVAFAFSHVVALLFIFAALGTFGRGSGASAGIVGPYQPAEQALLAEAVPQRYRNNLFGYVGFASSLGALIGTGPLTALPQLLTNVGLLNPHGLDSYRLTFILMAVGAAIAGILAIPVTDPFRARHKVSSTEPKAFQTTSEGKSKRGWRNSISQQSWPILWRLWITNSFNGLAVGFFGPFITYWFYERYGAGPATIGLLFSIINLAAMFSNLGAATFARRLGLVRAMLIGRLLQAVLLIPMVLAPSFWIAGAIYLVRMVAQRMALPLRQSYVMGVVPTEERGTVGALSNLPSQATSAVSPVLAGYLFDEVSLSLPFVIGAVLQGINAVLFYTFFRNILPPEEKTRSLAHKHESTGDIPPTQEGNVPVGEKSEAEHHS